jgi:hypothetical protein
MRPQRWGREPGGRARSSLSPAAAFTRSASRRPSARSARSRASASCFSRVAVCDRAQVGLIKARAKLLISEGKKRRDVEVPRGFWWPQGSAVLTVNWLLGDFETNHRTPSERRKAFGVTFRRAGSRIGTPSDAEPPADHGTVAE